MNKPIKIAAIACGLGFVLSTYAFSQSQNPPLPNSINPPSNTTANPLPNPINPPSTANPANTPNGTNPGFYPNTNETLDSGRLATPLGPALSDRDKVSCPTNQQAVIVGTRMVCMSRNSDIMPPENGFPEDSTRQPVIINR